MSSARLPVPPSRHNNRLFLKLHLTYRYLPVPQLIPLSSLTYFNIGLCFTLSFPGVRHPLLSLFNCYGLARESRTPKTWILSPVHMPILLQRDGKGADLLPLEFATSSRNSFLIIPTIIRRPSGGTCRSRTCSST